MLDAITPLKRSGAKSARRGKPAKPRSSYRTGGLKGLEAGRTQRRAQTYQGQSDQCAWIGAVDRFAQADAKAFALECACAVQRLLLGYITLNGGLVEPRKMTRVLSVNSISASFS